MTVAYGRTAHVYDLLYRAAGKDWAAESREVHDLIRARDPSARSLLDVACGTGGHLRHLANWYEVTGVDLEPDMLAEARRHLPKTPLVEADMRSFRLDKRFNAVICLSSAVGHLSTVEDLATAVATMTLHLAPGGLLIVDGWVLPQFWLGTVATHIDTAEDESIKVARVLQTRRVGDITHLADHSLIATEAGVEYVMTEHEMRLFAREEYEQAFRAAGLSVETQDSPMPGRDRYIGQLRRT